MRLGAPVFHWKTAEDWAARHVENGYGAAYWPLREGADAAQEKAFVDAAKDHDLVIAEVGVWNNLLHADPDEREQNIRYAVARLKTADRIGARCCVNIAGSAGDFWDGPHPNNLTQETFALIVQITQRILDEAQPTRTYYSLEPMPWMYPHDVQSLQRLIEAVDRPQFGVHADMCNLINAYEKVYHSAELTQAFFQAFGSRIRSVHAKDSQIAVDRLTLHIDEAIPGRGVFDLQTLLKACHRLGDIPVMAEHLETEEEYKEATGYLFTTAQALGIPFQPPHAHTAG